MWLRFFCLCVLSFPSNTNSQTATDLAAQHVICSAYSAMLAQVLSRQGMKDAAVKVGEWAESHAAEAIDRDRKNGNLAAWVTRDLISQLTAKLKESAKTPAAVMDLANKHQEPCVALAKTMPQAVK